MAGKRNNAETAKSEELKNISLETVNSELMRAMVDTARIGMHQIEKLFQDYFNVGKFDGTTSADEKREVIGKLLPGLRDILFTLFFQRVYLAVLYQDMTDLDEVIDFVYQESGDMMREVADMFGRKN